MHLYLSLPIHLYTYLLYVYPIHLHDNLTDYITSILYTSVHSLPVMYNDLVAYIDTINRHIINTIYIILINFNNNNK